MIWSPLCIQWELWKMPCEAFSLVVSLQVIATLDKKNAFEYVEKNENVFWEQLKALLLLSLICRKPHAWQRRKKLSNPSLFNHVLFYNTAAETVLGEEHHDQLQGGPLKICRCAEKWAPNKDDVSFVTFATIEPYFSIKVPDILFTLHASG